MPGAIGVAGAVGLCLGCRTGVVVVAAGVLAEAAVVSECGEAAGGWAALVDRWLPHWIGCR